MKAFKIVDGDIVFDEVMNIEMVDGLDEVAQCVSNTFNVNTREWFLNTSHGLNYQGIRGKGKTVEEIELEIITAAMQEPRVEEVVRVDVDINDKERTVNIYFEAATEEGVLRFREVI